MLGYSVVISGVGGQGVLLASQIIANAAIAKKMKVRVGETHGMAQRGGSIIAHVRFGNDIYGSITPVGEGDVLMAFEPVEAIRYLEFMKNRTTAILNTHPIIPVSVSTGNASYPKIEDIKKRLSQKLSVKALDATKLAVEAGNQITLNMVMIGAFAQVTKDTSIPLKKEVLLEAMKRRVPKKYFELNKKAFELGFNAVK
ncbi:MAG: indolepyruvate ferredoxin oxidoreductase subunit beta [Candidatus Methanofastidiosia archaeon]